MENASVVTTEPPQPEEVVEVKQEPKKRGRKPKSATPVVSEVAVLTPQVADQGEQREPAVDVPTAELEPISDQVAQEEPTPEAVTEAKPKVKRATRTTKKTKIDVVPIQHTLEESNVEVQIQEEPIVNVTRELTPEQQQELLVKLLREQQLSKRSQKQQKYKHLITSAF